MKVTYEDHMGDDLKVVNMARVSFGKRSEWLPSGSVNDYPDVIYQTVEGKPVNLSKPDQSLISFLARGCTSGDWESLEADVIGTSGDIISFWNGRASKAENIADKEALTELLNHIKKMPSHWTPFGHCQVTLHMKVPIFIARQIMKSQVGFVVNEVSRRYVTDEPEFYVPEVWRKAAPNVKQGSLDEGVVDIWMQDYGENYETDVGSLNSAFISQTILLYNSMIQGGVCPEQARMVLPQSMYTEFYMTGSLKGWTDMYNQRSDSHAQKEVQMVAQQIKGIVEPLFPVSWRELTK